MCLFANLPDHPDHSDEESPISWAQALIRSLPFVGMAISKYDMFYSQVKRISYVKYQAISELATGALMITAIAKGVIGKQYAGAAGVCLLLGSTSVVLISAYKKKYPSVERRHVYEPISLSVPEIVSMK